MTTLYSLHFVFLAVLTAGLGCLFWLARMHDRG